MKFLKLRRHAGLAVLASLFLAGLPARAADVTVTVHSGDPGPTISRYLYGHFLEHLGRAVYDGVWVGRDSPIPNQNGLRLDVLNAMQELQVPVIRWPGGCYADEYHWKTGVGPADERPVTINMSWGGVEESNEFGTHEFFEFIEALGADAYIAGNLGSGTVHEMVEWLEYMTSPSRSTLAEQRRSNGRDEPFQVPFFGVGNESWGCGGNMTPEYYVNLYKQAAEFLEARGQRLRMIASGGSDSQTHWTEALSQIGSNINGISHHYYTVPTGNWGRKGNATGFEEDQWISTLFRAMRIDDYITAQVEILDRNNPRGNIGLYLDEWGTWYDPTPGASQLYQQNSLRDAFVAALHFHAFHRHAERLHMANIAQTVNVLQAMILTEGDRMLLTPTYHLFRMYIPFQDATYLPVSTSGDPTYEYADYAVPTISATAALGTDGRSYASVANLDPNESSTITLDLDSGGVRNVSMQILSGNAIDAHNTFDDPDNVEPAAFTDFELSGGQLQFEIPAKSIVMIAFDG